MLIAEHFVRLLFWIPDQGLGVSSEVLQYKQEILRVRTRDGQEYSKPTTLSDNP